MVVSFLSKPVLQQLFLVSDVFMVLGLCNMYSLPSLCVTCDSFVISDWCDLVSYYFGGSVWFGVISGFSLVLLCTVVVVW